MDFLNAALDLLAKAGPVALLTMAGIWVGNLITQRARYELPVIIVRAIHHRGDDPSICYRSITFDQAGEAAKWLVRAVRIRGQRKAWLVDVSDGEGIADNSGHAKGYRVQADSRRRRVRFDPPVEDGTVLVHPDAPTTLRLSFAISYRSRPRVRRRVPVIVTTS